MCLINTQYSFEHIVKVMGKKKMNLTRLLGFYWFDEITANYASSYFKFKLNFFCQIKQIDDLDIRNCLFCR